jgi:hypothetical protein
LMWIKQQRASSYRQGTEMSQRLPCRGRDAGGRTIMR